MFMFPGSQASTPTGASIATGAVSVSPPAPAGLPTQQPAAAWQHGAAAEDSLCSEDEATAAQILAHLSEILQADCVASIARQAQVQASGGGGAACEAAAKLPAGASAPAVCVPAAAAAVARCRQGSAASVTTEETAVWSAAAPSGSKPGARAPEAAMRVGGSLDECTSPRQLAAAGSTPDADGAADPMETARLKMAPMTIRRSKDRPYNMVVHWDGPEVLAGPMQRVALQKYLYMPLQQAADKLALGTTVMKKVSRHFGLHQWPHRQIKSTVRTADGVQDAAVKELCQEELSRQLANPGRKLSQEFLAQRQRHDKREYKQRMKRTGS